MSTCILHITNGPKHIGTAPSNSSPITPSSKKIRRYKRIGASECLERERGPGGPPSEQSERVYGVN